MTPRGCQDLLIDRPSPMLVCMGRRHISDKAGLDLLRAQLGPHEALLEKLLEAHVAIGEADD